MTFVQMRIQDQASGFGKDLRELRELRGYSQATLAKLSGIHPTMIAAFEDERLEEIADPAYAERHVRTLVRILEGRLDFFLQKYHALLESRHLIHAPQPTLRHNVRKRDFFVSSRFFVFLGFLAMVLTVGAYVVLQARQISSAPVLIVVSPLEGQITDSSHVTVDGSTDSEAIVLVNGQNAIVDASGKFQIVVDVVSGVSTIRVEARRRYSHATIVERHLMFERPASGTSTTPTATTTSVQS